MRLFLKNKHYHMSYFFSAISEQINLKKVRMRHKKRQKIAFQEMSGAKLILSKQYFFIFFYNMVSTECSSWIYKCLLTTPFFFKQNKTTKAQLNSTELMVKNNNNNFSFYHYLILQRHLHQVGAWWAVITNMLALFPAWLCLNTPCCTPPCTQLFFGWSE